MMLMNYFCSMVDWRMTFSLFFQLGPLSEILTIANIQHTTSRVGTCAEHDFRFGWISRAVVITTTSWHHHCLVYDKNHWAWISLGFVFSFWQKKNCSTKFYGLCYFPPKQGLQETLITIMTEKFNKYSFFLLG